MCLRCRWYLRSQYNLCYRCHNSNKSNPFDAYISGGTVARRRVKRRCPIRLNLTSTPDKHVDKSRRFKFDTTLLGPLLCTQPPTSLAPLAIDLLNIVRCRHNYQRGSYSAGLCRWTCRRNMGMRGGLCQTCQQAGWGVPPGRTLQGDKRRTGDNCWV